MTIHLDTTNNYFIITDDVNFKKNNGKLNYL